MLNVMAPLAQRSGVGSEGCEALGGTSTTTAHHSAPKRRKPTVRAEECVTPLRRVGTQYCIFSPLCRCLRRRSAAFKELGTCVGRPGGEDQIAQDRTSDDGAFFFIQDQIVKVVHVFPHESSSRTRSWIFSPKSRSWKLSTCQLTT